jgi:hypothetical protein
MTVNRGGAKFGDRKWLSCEEPIDPANPGDWVLVEDNEYFRRWEADLGDSIVCRTEHKGSAQLLKDNHEAMAESAGQPWGDGKVFGSVPLNIYFQSGLAEANKQRDRRFIARWWNDPEHAKFRKFKGTI